MKQLYNMDQKLFMNRRGHKGAAGFRLNNEDFNKLIFNNTPNMLTHPGYKNTWTDFKKYIVEAGIYKEIKLTL